MAKSQPLRILITNDDGIHGEGLWALVDAAKELGEPVVVAPDRERSACGHAMTMREPLRVRRVKDAPCLSYEVSGVPTDCVNVGLTEVFREGCDLVLSGINYGPNLGFDITYSGTVAGAMEGTINGIRSIAVSMAIFVSEAPPHFETGTEWLKENWDLLLGVELDHLTFLNVNVPAIDVPELNGHSFVRMGERVYRDRVEKRQDPWGRDYWWQGGVVVMDAQTPGTDVYAVSQGAVSITPISLDWTRHDVIAHMNK
jgi:5'-nucleotidase